MVTDSPYTEQELWEKYLQVTKELLKFIDQEDIDTFLDLVDQRQQLMDMLNDLDSHTFADSEEGKAIKVQIVPMDEQIMYKARSWLNKSRNTNATVKGYDVTGQGAAGNMFRREY